MHISGRQQHGTCKEILHVTQTCKDLSENFTRQAANGSKVIGVHDLVPREITLKNLMIQVLSCEPLIGPLPGLDLRRIDWVIVGGESGSRLVGRDKLQPRPMKEERVVDIQRQCEAAEVDFFFKQWGGTNKGWFKVFRTDGKRDHHLARRGATKGGYWNEVSDRGVTKYGRMTGAKILPSPWEREQEGEASEGLWRRAIMPPKRDTLCHPREESGAAVAGADLG